MSVFDAKAFLGDLGFSGTDLDELAPKFSTPERAAALEKSVKRQSDYSRAMDAGRAEIAAKQAELQAKEQQLVGEASEWAQLTAQEKAASGTLRQQLEQTQAEALRHRQQLERLAQEAGVDPKTLVGDAPVAVVTKPTETAPAFDPKYASAESIGALARMSLQLPAQIADLKDEHFALTGQRLNTTALVAEMERRASTKGNTKPVDLRAIWEETHAIGQVRQDAEAARVKALEDAAFTRGREAALTEQHLPPGAVPTGRHAIVFGQRESVLKRPQPGEGLQAAVNAFKTGKYRPGGAGTTT